jgi:hypothetical protein
MTFSKAATGYSQTLAVMPPRRPENQEKYLKKYFPIRELLNTFVKRLILESNS